MLLSCNQCVSHEAPSYHVILTKLLLSLSRSLSHNIDVYTGMGRRATAKLFLTSLAFADLL